MPRSRFCGWHEFSFGSRVEVARLSLDFEFAHDGVDLFPTNLSEVNSTTSGKGGFGIFLAICELSGAFGVTDAHVQGGMVGDLSYMQPEFIQSLKNATMNFHVDNFHGSGGFGPVYKFTKAQLLSFFFFIAPLSIHLSSKSDRGFLDLKLLKPLGLKEEHFHRLIFPKITEVKIGNKDEGHRLKKSEKTKENKSQGIARRQTGGEDTNIGRWATDPYRRRFYGTRETAGWWCDSRSTIGRQSVMPSGGEARDNKPIISNRPFSPRDRVKGRPRKHFKSHGKNDNGFYHFYYLIRFGTLANPLTSFWRHCRGLESFVPKIYRMQFGQEVDYMGTQSYQNNFNHWWEPHSYLDQNEKEKQSSLRKETLGEIEQRLLDEQISCALKSLGIIGVNTEVDPRKECQSNILANDKVNYEEKIEDEITKALVSLGIIRGNTEVDPKKEDIPKEEDIHEEKIEEDEITKALISLGIIRGNTEVDPKEEYQVTIFENDEEKVEKEVEEIEEEKIVRLSEGEKNQEKEQAVEKKRKRGQKKRSHEKPLPHKKKYHRKGKRFMSSKEIFKKLEIKVPMINTWKHVLGVLNFLKRFSRKKKKRISSNTTFTDECHWDSIY
ncbi:hypothetical protein V8G54_030330 [Vigna mungo]|uniref:Uncharacterized protein n=1 Tax=Vigna mungo TaxID=3915 RepID=A0AAQ3MWG9_VIGMU